MLMFIAGLFVAMIFVFVLWAGDVISFRSAHRHTWEVCGVDQLYLFKTFNGVRISEEGTPVTEVLYRCATCHEVDTKRVVGHWTEQQIIGGMAKQ